jgi:hypothetical protein
MKFLNRFRIKREEDFLVFFPMFFGALLSIGLILGLKIFAKENIPVVVLMCLGGGYCVGWFFIGYGRLLNFFRRKKRPS